MYTTISITREKSAIRKFIPTYSTPKYLMESDVGPALDLDGPLAHANGGRGELAERKLPLPEVPRTAINSASAAHK